MSDCPISSELRERLERVAGSLELMHVKLDRLARKVECLESRLEDLNVKQYRILETLVHGGGDGGGEEL